MKFKTGDIVIVKNYDRFHNRRDDERAEYEGKKLIVTGYDSGNVMVDFIEKRKYSYRYGHRPEDSLELAQDFSLLSDIII